MTVAALFLALLLAPAGCAFRDYNGTDTVDVADAVLAIHCALDAEVAPAACDGATVVDVQATIAKALDPSCKHYGPVCWDGLYLETIGGGWLGQVGTVIPGSPVQHVELAFLVAGAAIYAPATVGKPWQAPFGGPWVLVCSVEPPNDDPYDYTMVVCAGWDDSPRCE